MTTLESSIADFLGERGVEVFGFAGADRLVGPPSANPRHVLRGARSIVSLALPMHVGAIDDFLAKRSPVPHNLDQLKQAQRLYRISRELAELLRADGHRAREVPINNSYRRKLNVLRPDPTFSHRFGAIAAGVGCQGLSGNVVTERYGAAVYLSTVVTSARLEASPIRPPDHVMRTRCDECGICAETCATGMFVADDSEYVLLGGELHPRGRRRNLDFCNSTCFGLHGLSRDHTWSTWGRFWIRGWVDGEQDPANREKIRRDYLWRGATTGDSTPRYRFIVEMFNRLWPRELVEDRVPAVEDLPDDPAELDGLLWRIEREMGVEGVLGDPSTLTCGHCALVCGPDLAETRRRYEVLRDGGIVVPGPDGRMVQVRDYAEAVEYKKRYRPPLTRADTIADARASMKLWRRLYFGFGPLSALQGWIYRRRLERAVRSRRAATEPASGARRESEERARLAS